MRHCLTTNHNNHKLNIEMHIECKIRNYTLFKCNKVTHVSYIFLKIQAMALRNPLNLVFIPNMADAWYICLKKVSLQKAWTVSKFIKIYQRDSPCEFSFMPPMNFGMWLIIIWVTNWIQMMLQQLRSQWTILSILVA